MALKRCPQCGKIGSEKNAGFCGPCSRKNKEDAPWIGNHWISDKFPTDREFIPESDTFGIVKDKFGYER